MQLQMVTNRNTTKETRMQNINYLVQESILESEIVDLILEVKSVESLKNIQKALNQRKQQLA